MSIFKSATDTSLVSLGSYTGMFTHDRGSKLQVVKNEMINSDELGVERGKVELIKGAYSERIIDITIIHKPEIELNSVFEFDGSLWIAKVIQLEFKAPSLYMTLKAIRYE